MLDFFATGGKLRFRATVNDIDGLRPQTLCAARRVHGDVAASHDGDLFCVQDGRLAALFIRLHKIGAGKIFVRGEDALRPLALDPHEAGQSRTRSKEHRLKSVLVLQFVNGENAPDDGVRFDLHAQRFEPFDLLPDDLLGKAEFGDPVDEHAPATCRASNTVTS